MAAAAGNVNIGASAGADEELVIGAHFHVVVIAVRNRRSGGNGTRDEVDQGNFAAGGGQGWGGRTGASVGARLAARDIEGVTGKQSKGGGIHRNGGAHQITVHVEQSDAGGGPAALRSAIQDIGGRIVTAKKRPNQRVDNRRLIITPGVGYWPSR